MLVHQMYLRNQFLPCSTSSEFPTFGWRTDDFTFRGGDDGCEGRVGGSERYYRLISLILSSIDNRSSNEERFPSPWRAYSCTTWRCVEGEGYYWRASLSCAVFRRKANLVRVMSRSAISLPKCDSRKNSILLAIPVLSPVYIALWDGWVYLTQPAKN